MTTEMFSEWLAAYIACQEQGNPEVIRHLWASDGVYWWGPFNQPRYGVDAVYEHHRHALSHQRDWRCQYTVLGVADGQGMARFRLTLNDDLPGEPNVYDGVFLVRLNAEGKCTLFEEWYHATLWPQDPVGSRT